MYRTKNIYNVVRVILFLQRAVTVGSASVHCRATLAWFASQDNIHIVRSTG